MIHQLLPSAEFIGSTASASWSELVGSCARAMSGFRRVNKHVHLLAGDTPEEQAGAPTPPAANLANYRFQSQGQGLVQLPIAAWIRYSPCSGVAERAGCWRNPSAV